MEIHGELAFVGYAFRLCLGRLCLGRLCLGDVAHGLLRFLLGLWMPPTSVLSAKAACPVKWMQFTAKTCKNVNNMI